VFFAGYSTPFQVHLLEKHLYGLIYLSTKKNLSFEPRIFAAKSILTQLVFAATCNKTNLSSQFYLITFTKNKECSK